ncbi:hypothetical protein M5689_001182 [Euphorbia peplus]|nr:hypothetical protein M5689_001182 [Euphorbia peplus]
MELTRFMYGGGVGEPTIGDGGPADKGVNVLGGTIATCNSDARPMEIGDELRGEDAIGENETSGGVATSVGSGDEEVGLWIWSEDGKCELVVGMVVGPGGLLAIGELKLEADEIGGGMNEFIPGCGPIKDGI